MDIDPPHPHARYDVKWLPSERSIKIILFQFVQVEDMKIRNRACLPVLLACLIAIVAVTIFLWTTRQGIGIQGDSTAYLGTAQNLLKGNGFTFSEEPMTAYAPFYPMVLAFSGLFNPDILIAARWLHAVLFAINALLFAGIFYAFTNCDLLVAGLAAAIFLSSKTVIFVYTLTWSEPLFITLAFSTCLLLARYFVTLKWKYLLFGSLLCGLAILTRYVGLALLPAVGICILFLSAQPLKKRSIALITFGSIAITPIAVWAVRNMLITRDGHQAARAFLFHPRPITTLGREFTDLIYKFIFPGDGSKYWMAAMIGLILSGLVVLLVLLWKNRKVYLQEHFYELSHFCLTGLVSISYFAVVIVSFTIVDAAIPISERIFIPALLFSTIFAFSALFLNARLKKGDGFYWVSVALMVLFMYFNISDARVFAQDLHEEGIGYNSVRWQNSATLNAISELDTERTIYSNNSGLIVLLTGRQIEPFPSKYSNRLSLQNANYEQELIDMCDEVRNGDAIIVWLERVDRPYLTEFDELVDVCQLPYQIDLDDGTIFAGEMPAEMKQ